MVERTYTPYTPADKEYPKLTEEQKIQLFNIEPSVSQGLEQRPCRVVLKDGRIFNNVYIVEAEAFIKSWGVWPEDDPGKKSLDISSVEVIEVSPNRLPVALSNKLYAAGESSMGGVIFSILFSDGTEQGCEYGNAIDFVDLPKGKVVSDIQDVIPHKEVARENTLNHPEFLWCLYSK